MNIFKSADILIPVQGTDFSKWSVVACDQYTSEPIYWAEVKNAVGSEPSTLNIIFPEVYLEDGDGQERINNINSTMEEYIKSDLFETLENSYVYVERVQSDGKLRHGLVGAVDLEEYDFRKGSQSAIRATEGTIIERIPPRQRIRINASLELPHILMLVDDKENEIIATAQSAKADLRLVYDFDLMQNSGHIKGYQVSGEVRDRIDSLLDKLKTVKEQESTDPEKGALIFAVGDGNHSLATAKTCWEEIKKNLTNEEQKNHPARFALVELVNLYDSAIEFEPIHRVVFDVDPEKMISALYEYYPETSDEDNGGQRTEYVYGGREGTLYINGGRSNLAVGTVQNFIDDYIAKNGGRVDYIHGADVVKKLSGEPNTMGFLFDGMEKTQLYPTVISDGSLPRKTFSMGEAADKRFYLEAKKIR